jgi:hypothetical protein
LCNSESRPPRSALSALQVGVRITASTSSTGMGPTAGIEAGDAGGGISPETPRDRRSASEEDVEEQQDFSMLRIYFAGSYWHAHSCRPR